MNDHRNLRNKNLINSHLIENSSIDSSTNPSLSSRKQTIANSFSKANNYDTHATVQQQTCEQLIKKIINNQQDSVLEIGAGSGQLTRLLASHIHSKHWTINELVSKHANTLQDILPDAQIIIGDAENLALYQKFSEAYSLVISANAVQWFDNPLSIIDTSHAHLKSKGQLLISTFTPNNFLQIKQLTGEGLSYPSIEQWQDRLQSAGFNDIELTTHRHDVPFANPYAVLKHIKNTGVSATIDANDAKPFIWTKTKLKEFETAYWHHFGSTDEQGKPCVHLTYDVLIISAIR